MRLCDPTANRSARGVKKAIEMRRKYDISHPREYTSRAMFETYPSNIANYAIT